MDFYEIDNTYKVAPPPLAQYPCVLLVRDNWNDFGYRTMWNVVLYKDEANIVLNANIKILQRDASLPSQARSRTTIPKSFTDLPREYCSLGQDLEYYAKLYNCGSELYSTYFKAIRDVAIFKNIASEFYDLEAFKVSLLRFSEAEKAFNEAKSVFFPTSLDELYRFSFKCLLTGADSPHNVDFDFSAIPTNLNRTTVLIGKNGTGKTQFLAQFAMEMSGLRIAPDHNFGFWPHRPSFSRVIAVSYSVFDDFARPPNVGADSRTFSYRYCGIRTSERHFNQDAPNSDRENPKFLSPSELQDRLEKDFLSIQDQDRESQWREVLSILLQDVCDFNEEPFRLNCFKYLSSGQRILVAIMTDIIANISKQSIILFDEPELHLHPELFISLARAFDHLLKSFDSYAIISTHSALLLQETLATQVRIFRRRGNEPIVDPLTIECFGENLTVITSEVFAVDGDKHNFRAHLNELMEGRSAAEVESLFPKPLPLQALAYLRALEDTYNNE